MCKWELKRGARNLEVCDEGLRLALFRFGEELSLPLLGLNAQLLMNRKRIFVSSL